MVIKRSGSKQLRYTRHALERMDERNFSFSDVEAVVQYGTPRPGSKNEVQYTVEPSRVVWTPGEQSAPLALYGSVVVLSSDGICITVYRKDESHAS